MEVKNGEMVEIVIVDPHVREHRIMVPEKNPISPNVKLGPRQLWTDKPITTLEEEVIKLTLMFEIDQQWHICGLGSDGKRYCSLIQGETLSP